MFDGKNPWFPVDFPINQSNDVCFFKLITVDSTRWCPPNVINWFINPINYRYITNKNHRYWSYEPTERYLGGTVDSRWIAKHSPKVYPSFPEKKFCNSVSKEMLQMWREGRLTLLAMRNTKISRENFGELGEFNLW